MKKILLFFSCIVFSQLQAQITINSNHMPVNGDTLRYTIALLDSAVLSTYQTSGANVSWNYSNLIPQRQGVRSFRNSSQTPYSISIPNRLGEKLADTLDIGGFSLYNVYDFFNSTTSDFSLDYRGASVPTGLGFPFPATLNLTPSFSDKDEIYQFPLNYLDRDSSTFNVVFNNVLPALYYGSNGYRINNVDAWGSLTTPFGTFNTIRVVTDVVAYDTVNFSTNAIGINSHIREYKWLTTSLRIPAMTVSGNVIAGVFIPTTVQYRDSIRNVPSLFAPVALFDADERNPSLGDTVNFNNLSISLLSANYQWNISPSTFSYTNGTSAVTEEITVVFNDTGFYDVSLIAVNSSGRDTLTLNNYIRVDILSSVEKLEKDEASKLKIFPNPVNSNQTIQLTVENNLKVERVIFYDISGKIIHDHTTSQGSTFLELKSPKTRGIYFIRIETNRGFTMKKLIVQ
mgnify:CR=1 FL=1|tara:strand:- start:217 stop:1587 length:1371 start_codon:yes stop_codon:yes gene_type:complete